MPATDLSRLDGFFKQVYADDLINVVTPGVVLTTEVDFVKKDKQQGGNYNQPVILQNEHGATYLGNGQSGAPAINGAIPSTTQNATVNGSQFTLQGELNYEVMGRASKNKNAFRDATAHLVMSMKESIDRKLETTMFHGGRGLGTVGAISGNTITITSAEFAAGVWIGSRGMPVQIFSTAGAVRTGGSVMPNTSLSNVFYITAVRTSDRTITLDGAPTGLAVGDVIWAAGSRGKEFLGLHAIQATNGSLFGIDNTAVDQWKAVEFSLSAAPKKALTTTFLDQAIARAQDNGLQGDVTAYVSNGAMSDLLSVERALRRYDDSYAAAAKTGFDGLDLRLSGVKVKVKPTNMVKNGYCHIVNTKDLIRIGATDVTFNRPGAANEGQFFYDLPQQAGCAWRAYYDQALFLERPAHSVLISGIVNGDL